MHTQKGFVPADDHLSVLRLLYEGHTDQTIARRLHRSERSIRGIISMLSGHTATRGRFALGAEAARRGWLEISGTCSESVPSP
ncbi:MAG: response regulator transcription factor [Glycomyces artemisiae]|uniref:Response regulator transcription factor n=1 Tax=Glycomyces artemisiae TaxID=1076443 RepID=A0A850CEB0_9ACTN|nr:response regulator transcription factor [Glycomyces artemisiae]